MKKGFSKAFILLLSVIFILSSFGMGVGAHEPPAQLSTAQVYGSFDFSSAELTTVIIQLDEPSLVEAKHKGKRQSKQRLAQVRNSIIQEVTGKADATVLREYDYVFSGFAVELPANQIPNLLGVAGIQSVFPNIVYQVDPMTTSIDAESYSPAMVDSAPFIGSQNAWDQGFTGKGVVVAIIDTGVDYTHPDLAHAFGAYKGWDFVDNNNDPQETKPGDPRGAATDHGTHVAGTVAANGGIKGVAPEATLLAYRVLGPGGSGTTANVIAGIERAVQDGANVMNLSLGNTLNSPDFATSLALDWAMAEGVVAVTSNGNSGANGNWSVGSPGTSRDAISVGATQLPYNVFSSTISTSEGVSYPSAKVMGFPSEEALLALNGGEYEFVHVGLGYPHDFVGKDLEGKIALISRGDFPFVDKATNAKNAGAVGAIIYNNVAGEQPDVPGMAIPTIKTTLADGQKLLAELAAGNNKVSFDVKFSQRVGETVAGFSSRGPAALTWMIKPDVSAPGVAIVSTIPNGYGAKQGTSMAAPHVAGAVALILEKHPRWTVDQVKAALMNSSERMIDPATGKEYPHNTQGAGSIRVDKALNVSLLATPGSYSFGVFTESDERRQHFTIENLSNKRVSATIDIQLKGLNEGINITTSRNLTIPARGKQNVNMVVKVDTTNLAPGYYEGSITLTTADNTIYIPTILFIGEPDYPRVTHAGMSKVAADNYLVWSFLPGGVDLVEYHVYVLNPNGTIGSYLGFIHEAVNQPAGYHEWNWNGKIGANTLPNGNYVLAVYAEKAGKADFRAYAITKN